MMEEKKILEALGFRRDWTYEIIAATYSGGRPHAAAMGICTRDLSSITLEVYKTAQTCENILSTRCFTVNFTKDVFLFYESVYEKEGLKYGKAKNVHAPCLKDAEAFIELKVIDATDLGDRMGFAGEIISFAKKEEVIHLLNRADALALECLIAASKIPHVSGREKEFLLEEIRYISRTVSKVAPGSAAEKAVLKTCSGMDQPCPCSRPSTRA